MVTFGCLKYARSFILLASQPSCKFQPESPQFYDTSSKKPSLCLFKSLPRDSYAQWRSRDIFVCHSYPDVHKPAPHKRWWPGSTCQPCHCWERNLVLFKAGPFPFRLFCYSSTLLSLWQLAGGLQVQSQTEQGYTVRHLIPKTKSEKEIVCVSPAVTLFAYSFINFPHVIQMLTYCVNVFCKPCYLVFNSFFFLIFSLVIGCVCILFWWSVHLPIPTSLTPTPQKGSHYVELTGLELIM